MRAAKGLKGAIADENGELTPRIGGRELVGMSMALDLRNSTDKWRLEETPAEAPVPSRSYPKS
ncbi:hypothetical protein VTJ49DRAFT_6686 [Mycothermus thermophilus]|uniref:Uncharacterized protein n=1 Tax=Humicola insolens TaxID=85995 RepID=A0ABR3VJE5_HUMIN